MRPSTRTFTTCVVAAMLLAVGAARIDVAAAHAGGGHVPFLAFYSGQGVFTSETTVSFAGTGVATHLGRSLDDGHATITGTDSSCPGGLANTHIETLTAANGDSITITAHNVACPIGPQQFRGSGTWVVSDGTGRFIDATGAGTFNGRVDFATAKFGFVLSGTILKQGA